MKEEELKRLVNKKNIGLRLRKPEIFERNKILTRQTADEIIAAYDTEIYYYSNTLHGTTITNHNYLPGYVLGILNSKLITWYYRTTTAEEGKVFAQIKIALLRQLPILKADKHMQRQVADLVTQINMMRNNGEHEAEIKNKSEEIDDLLYGAYGLTGKEIEIINSKER